VRFLIASLPIVLCACSGSDPGSTSQPPVGTDTSLSTGTSADTTPTADTASTPTPTVSATLDMGDQVVCASPTTRQSVPFDRKISAPVQPVGRDEAGLAGGGLIIADLDDDGHQDLFLSSLAPNDDQLWWGEGSETFDEQGRTAFANLNLSDAVGGSAADYDGDGDLDLYITRYLQPDLLLQNNGNRTFTDVTQQAGLGSHATDPPLPPVPKDPTRWADGRLSSQSASWADIDADGDLDLFVGTYGVRTVLDVTEPQANCDDHLADPSELWRNNGDGTFTDIAHLLPHDTHDGYLFMSGFYDLDGDGYPELVTAADDGYCAPSQVLHNQGGEAFVEDSYREDFDMGMGVGDLNGDELPDFLFSTWNGVSLIESAPGLGFGPTEVLYVDAVPKYKLTVDGPPRDNPGQAANGDQVYGWGAELADVDNDTDLDAVISFGYWSYYDGAGDPLMQNDGLWEQRDGQFTDIAPDLGMADFGVGRGVVLADLNGDGWIDVVKRHLNQGAAMYMSNCGAESWITVDLRQPGTMNTHAIGAKVRVTTSGGSQVRWIQSGSSGLYSGGPMQAHFGLADAETVDQLDVIWPDGATSTFAAVDARRHVTITRD